MTACPQETRLRDLLDESLSPQEQTELTAHLEDCPACRRRLEGLAAGSESWVAARGLGRGPAPDTAAPGLRRAVESLAGQPSPVETQAEDTPTPPETLAFLSPAREPGHLGRLDHYEVLEVVGRGGMGVVLKAFDEQLHRVVAVKALAAQLAASATARQRFVREARAAAAVVHEHVVAIHSIEEGGPLPYLVMQYVGGMSLQQRLERDGIPGLHETLRIGLQVAAGLAAAHAQGLVHRDVKPANILLENGVQRIKLTDFGLARAADDASLTQSGVIAGTPLYMSPEQARGEAVDARSDLFSLGSVLYQLCTGRPPFRAGTPLAVLKRVCEDTPRPVREINPDVPGWLCDVVARLHAKDRAERFQSAQEVAELLGRHLARLQQGEAGSAVGEGTRGRKPTSGRGPRAALLYAGLALLVLAVGALTAYLLVGGGTEEAGAPAGPARDSPREKGRTGEGKKGPADRPFVPPAPPTLQDLARIPSPLDELTRKDIPRAMLPLAGGGDARRAPAALVAVLADPRLLLPDPGHASWPAQDRAGHLLAVPCGESLALFRARTGAPFYTLRHKARVFSAALRHDALQLATATWDPAHTITVWDANTCKPLRTLNGHRATLLRLAYSPDGKRLASCADDRTAKIWDPDTGEEKQSLEGHTDHVGMVAFSHDGARLATGSRDGTVKVWEVATGMAVRTLTGHTGSVVGLAFSPDGKHLASGTNSEAKLWDAQTFAEMRTFERPAVWLAFTPDGRTLLSARVDHLKGTPHVVYRHDVATGKEHPELPLGTEAGHAVFDLSPDGKALFAMRAIPAAPRITAYDPGTGKPLKSLAPLGHSGPVYTVALSPNGKWAITGGADKAVRVWDLRSLPGGFHVKVGTQRDHPGKIYSMAYSPDGKLVAAGGLDGTISLRTTAGGKVVRTLTGHSPRLSWLTFSPDSRMLAAGGDKAEVRIWDVATGASREVSPARGGVVRGVAFSPDQKWLASAAHDGSVLVTELATGKTVRRFQRDRAVTAVAFSPDGGTLACVTNGPDAALHLCDLVGGKEDTLYGHKGDCITLAFHPAGHLLATAGTDGTVRLWSWERRTGGRQVKVLGPGPFAFAAYQVAFTPEGRYLATANANASVHLLRLSEIGLGPKG
jgi:eukaryotic-like serine/threonine-protein kinase